VLELAREFYRDSRHAQTDLCISHEIQRADLVVGATGDQGTRHTRLIGTLEFVLAASPFHPLAAHRGPVPPHVLRMQRAAVISQRANGPKSIVVPDVQAALGALKAGLAVGFLPRPLVARDLQDGSLSEIALERPPPPENFYLVWDDRPKGKAFNWLRERLDRPNLVAQWLAEPAPA
jgi:DNA-binding transcriptional LysR family regulator